ncbi:hypothetical protein HPB49_006842 [Dermacentor silvarum]|uniref:Uncharacterized protein n=1 Tax=Dermacentor silvarum TaxID=543639 RepID=A0ACB8C2H6_DERSI|nr:hypothetical protein HPB49_006842 [Dermacentor silvarum]
MSPGVYLKKSESSVALHALIRLHKGVIDNFLKWPYHHDVKLSFVQSSVNEKREFLNRTRRSLEHFARPTESCNTPCYYVNASLCLEDLERGSGGYAKCDQLWVKCKLLPPTA